MKLGKALIAGVVVTIFDAIVGMVTCGELFSWVYRIEPTNVWRPMEGNPGVSYAIGVLVLNIVLVLVYALIRKGIPGQNKLTKGLVFGLCVWAVGTLPGMFATHMFMTVATTAVIYLTILGLIFTPLKGLIIAAVYGQ